MLVKVIVSISTYMSLGNSSMRILLVLVVPVLFGNALPQTLSSYIDRLGAVDASSTLRMIDQYGCRALPQLIGRLKVLAPGHYPPDNISTDVQRQVYIIASLRHITGKDFYGEMSNSELKKYDEPAQQFLTDNVPKGHTKYFGWWPSHGNFYIAPRRAQKEIITSWKSYLRSGSCRHSNWRGRYQSTFYLSGYRSSR